MKAATLYCSRAAQQKTLLLLVLCTFTVTLQTAACMPNSLQHDYIASFPDAGELPEDIFTEQQKTQIDVLDLLRMVDHAANRGFKGAIPKREARVVLKGGHCAELIVVGR